MLTDSVTGEEKEVDVVIEAEADGDPIVTSYEVVDHTRPAGRPWVEAMVKKHDRLPTNRLVLVSWSGFTKPALAAAAVESRRLVLATPELIQREGQTVVKTLYVDQFTMSPTAVTVTVRKLDGTAAVYRAEIDWLVLDSDGVEVGNIMELTVAALRQEDTGAEIGLMAHNSPERDQIKYFRLGKDISASGMALRDETSGELHRIESLDIFGEFGFAQSELAFEVTDLANRRFGMAEADLLGKPNVWVMTTDNQRSITTISRRPL